MSYLSGVTVHLTGEATSPLHILQKLLDHGWTYNDQGSITYLPLGDREMYDWQQSPLDEWNTVNAVLESKINANERIGIILTWEDTLIGGDFHIAPSSQEVSVTWSVNRKVIEGGFTDHSWYLSKLLLPLSHSGMTISHSECLDTL